MSERQPAARRSGREADRELERLLNGHRLYRRIMKAGASFLMKLLYRVEYEGAANIPTQGPVLLVANHTSLLDIPAIHVRIRPWLYWVAKKELFQIPVIGGFFRAMGCIPVDRDKVDLAAARGIFGALAADRIVAIFPQATRTRPQEVRDRVPRPGVAHFAIKTQAPLVPVLIDGSYQLGRKIRIIFGPPFRLDASPRQRYSQAELVNFSMQIMRQIYRLRGEEYQLNPGALLAEGLVPQPDGTLKEQTAAEHEALELLRRSGQ
jgi:1-acyl-sn-glycerol-3-phosphate acyltransferase